jgi:predicted permease
VSVVLDVLAPVFGIIALGILAVRASLLEAAGVRGVVAFVFNFALPVLLFRSMAGVALPDRVPWSFLAAFYSASLTTYALGMAVGRWGFRRPADEQAIFGMAASFSNTVFLGIPIILAALGPEATLPVFLIIAFHSATFMPLTVALIHLGRGEARGAVGQVVTLVRAVVKDPIVMGLLLGLLANLAGLELRGSVDRMAELLGGAALPAALFAMGASLAGHPAGSDGAPASVLAFLKLVVHPALVWVVAVPLLGLEGVWAATAVLMAGMPTAVNTYLFGARYGAAPSVAARAVLVSSAASLVTLAVLLVAMAR